VYRNLGPPDIGYSRSAHPNEVSRVGSLFRLGVVGTGYLCVDWGFWLAGPGEVGRPWGRAWGSPGQDWGAWGSHGVRCAVGGGQQVWRW